MTPINDFINEYNKSGTLRLHMPGHKGIPLTGAEILDITEIKGADYLFEAEGVIAESERCMADAFGTRRTCYSTEGSSLSIKGMLAAVREQLGRLEVAAVRNCHRAFVNGCILLGLDPVWIYPQKPSGSLCASAVTAADVERTLCLHPNCNAVYLTSPDYPGNIADIKGISKVCKRHGAMLLVDNAHGAYLAFTGKSMHPMQLGADICADSAHKTLPALTGASMLHISHTAPEGLESCVKEAMSLFASTSPSYVILSSLDRCAEELHASLPERIRACCSEVSELSAKIRSLGFELTGSEPMKLTVSPLSYGYTGTELAELMRQGGIEPEYADSSCVVLMPSPYNEGLGRIVSVLGDIPRRPAKQHGCPDILPCTKALSPREAYLSPYKRIPTGEAAGRICARTAISCQPSVPIVVPGEIFDENAIKILENYSIFNVSVVK